MFPFLSLIRTNFLFDLFSDDTLASSNLTDKNKYGLSVKDIDPSLNEYLNNDWVIFGTKTCPFTRKAVFLLKYKENQPEFIDKEGNMKNVYEKLKTFLSHDTIPLIINDGNFLGGYSQLLEYYGMTDEEITRLEKMQSIDNIENKSYFDVTGINTKNAEDQDRLLF